MFLSQTHALQFLKDFLFATMYFDTELMNNFELFTFYQKKHIRYSNEMSQKYVHGTFSDFFQSGSIKIRLWLNTF